MHRFLTIAVLALALIGCRGPSADAQVPPFLHCPEATLADTLADQAFNQSHPITAPDGTLSIDLTDMRRFCRETPQAVLCAGGEGKKLSLEEVVRVDASLRAIFHYTSDQAAFHKPDYWTNATICGDCEDYALTLSEKLHDSGEAGADMAAIVWAPYAMGAHVTLLVDTSDAGQVEIGVGPDEVPHLYNAAVPFRLGLLVMDGKREISLFPNVTFHTDPSQVYVTLKLPPAPADVPVKSAGGDAPPKQ